MRHARQPASTASITKSDEPTAIVKASVFGGEPPTPTALANPEDENELYQIGEVIVPPYEPAALCRMVERSASLRPNIDAYAVNIEAFGHRLKTRIDLEVDGSDDKIRDALLLERIFDGKFPAIEPTDVEARKLEIKAGMRIERLQLENFFENCVDSMSFVELRKRTRYDLETTGNAYWEILRDRSGAISQLVFVPSVSMRIMRSDVRFTECEIARRVTSISVRRERTKRRFRRYVQYLRGTPIVWFKELDDPRVVSSKTGIYYASLEEMRRSEPRSVPANEILHFRIYSPTSVYGVPRWIGATLAVVGSRAAEEVNATYFDNKAVPPLAILVSGGRLADGTAERIKNFVRDHLQGRENFHSIMVLEADSAGSGSMTGSAQSRVRIDVKPLMEAQQNDALFQTYDANNAEKVGNQFRLPRLLRGNMSDFNRACYSSDTETLTETGWKLHAEIGEGERIAAYNPGTGEIAFVVPAKKLVYHVDAEEMWHFHNRQTDCLVTHDHKMVVKSTQTRAANPPWETFAADAIPYDSFAVPLAADRWESTETLSEFTLPKLDTCKIERGHNHAESVRGDDWIEFVGYFVAEGGLVTTEHSAAEYLVYIDQKKPGVAEKIRACLDRLGWKYSTQIKPCGTTHFLLSNRCLRAWLVQHCGTHAQAKRVPWQYLNLEVRQLRILLDALMAGDGSIDTRSNRTSAYYSSTSPVLAGQVQRLFVQLGQRATVGLHYEANGNRTACWRVMTCRTRTTQLLASGSDRVPASVERLRYTGEVYCFSVPGYGFFVTRRNGKIAIQGNTAEGALQYAEQQVFQPERNEIDYTIDRRILAAKGVRYHEFVSNAPDMRDPPVVAKMLADLVEACVITPHEARTFASEVFNEDLPSNVEPWTRIPPRLLLQGIQPAPTEVEIEAAKNAATNGKQEQPNIAIAPTDAVRIMRVNEARASIRLSPLEGPEGNMMVGEYFAKTGAPMDPSGGQGDAGKTLQALAGVRKALEAARVVSVEGVQKQIDARRLVEGRRVIKVPAEEFARWVIPEDGATDEARTEATPPTP